MDRRTNVTVIMNRGTKATADGSADPPKLSCNLRSEGGKSDPDRPLQICDLDDLQLHFPLGKLDLDNVSLSAADERLGNG